MGRRNKRNRQSRLPKEIQPLRVRLNFELKKVCTGVSLDHER
jgi:hypothetical protein